MQTDELRAGRARRARLLRVIALARAFEESIGDLWEQGLVSGELHLGIGEEGVAAAVVDHLRDGDSLALDHRPTPALVARGIDLEALVLELIGHEAGLCRGRGGHMHLFAPDLLAASSGIVGAAVPTACGFALAHQQAAEGSVAVAFVGEGATNQGMVLEGWNLAATWRLPVVFVVKDSGWAITTRSQRVTSGSIVRRARGFGLPVAAADGWCPEAVWRSARRAVDRARRGRGPTVIVTRVVRPRGHLEGDPLVRMSHDPREVASETRALVAGARAGPVSAVARTRGVAEVARTLATMMRDQLGPRRDPLDRIARGLDASLVESVREDAAQTVDDAVASALRRTLREGVRP